MYLRARWYDSKLGRFISGDPFEGRQGDLRSLNRYSYAHGDPVHWADPTGKFSVALSSPVVGGLAIDASFAVAGFALAGLLAPSFDQAVASTKTTLWHILVYGKITHHVPQAANDAARNMLAKQRRRTDKADEAHHTIPKYLCGNDNQVKPVITFAEHQAIHSGLSLVALSIEEVGGNVARILNVPLGRRRNSMILALGENPLGRAGISAAIGAFYDVFGGEFGRPDSINNVFPSERHEFVNIGKRHPFCGGI